MLGRNTVYMQEGKQKVTKVVSLEKMPENRLSVFYHLNDKPVDVFAICSWNNIDYVIMPMQDIKKKYSFMS